MAVSGEELYRTITSSGGDVDTLEIINTFKAHVKKDFINLNDAPKYLEALTIGLQDPDPLISTASFSVLAHLIKRISMQDPNGTILQQQALSVLPGIIQRLGDPKGSIRNTAKRALEGYWLASFKEVEQILLDYGLKSKNSLIVLESVLWLQYIVTEISQLFKLDAFVPILVTNLRNEEEVQIAVKQLFASYYSMKHNYLHKHILLKELTSERIPQKVCDEIMSSILRPDLHTTGLYSSHTTPNNTINNNSITSQSTGNLSKKSSSNKVSIPSRTSSTRKDSTSSTRSWHSNSPKHAESDSKQDFLETVSNDTNDYNIPQVPQEIIPIVSKIPKFAFDYSLEPANVDNIHDAFTSLLTPFAGKETEFNWAQRERNIITMRSILRGNARNQPAKLILALKESAESICKAVISLRTTLSTHGCQLIKESSMLLGTHFDILIDHFTPTLTKLCVATKSISSNNANMALVSIYLHSSYSSKLLHRVQIASQEKNHQPKAYCGLWMQILLIRFHSNSAFLAGHGPVNGPDVCASVITKLISDPKPTVRQSAQELYWCFWSKFPTQAETLLSKFDNNVVKAMERSRPKGNSSTDISTTNLLTTMKQPKRPSIRESILAKKRELRDIQRKEASSRPSSSTEKSINQPFALNRLQGGPRRNFTESPVVNDPMSSHSIEPRVVSAGAEHQPRPAFNKQTDPIIQFLSSHKSELKIEGINLLKYAIMGDEEFSNEIPSLLKNIAVSYPQILKPLFSESDEMLKKSSKLFDFNDFIRVNFIILEKDVSIDFVDTISEIVSNSDLYNSIGILLTQSTKISSILNNSDMVMQMIKYKMVIFKNTIAFLNYSLHKIPINDTDFEKICSCLIEMLSMLRGSEIYDSLLKLLETMYNINNEIFKTQVQRSGNSLEDIIEIDKDTNSPPQTTDKNYTSYELTKVFPNSNISLSPLKAPSDLTMLMPSFSGPNKFMFNSKSSTIDNEPQFNTVVEENIDDDQDDLMNVEKEENVFVELENSSQSKERRSDLFAKFHKENSTDLITDFSQVQIGNTAEAQIKDNLQTFIEKVDPINKVSSKKKPIEIYQDEIFKGSPQKVRNYNYEDMNWFNFVIAKEKNFVPEEIEEIKEATTIENSLEFFCNKLESNQMTPNDFSVLLKYIQESQVSSNMEGSTLKTLQASFWKFFEQNSESSNVLPALVIIKQLLVKRIGLNPQHLWNSLVLLSNSTMTDENSEIILALHEVFDEMIIVSMSTEDALNRVISTFERNLQPKCFTFVLECLEKVLNINSIGLLINDSYISQIDGYIASQLNNDDVMIRRNVVSIYGRLLKLSQVIEINKTGTTDKNLMHSILQRLPVPQRKIIEYYSEQ